MLNLVHAFFLPKKKKKKKEAEGEGEEKKFSKIPLYCNSIHSMFYTDHDLGVHLFSILIFEPPTLLTLP